MNHLEKKTALFVLLLCFILPLGANSEGVFKVSGYENKPRIIESDHNIEIEKYITDPGSEINIKSNNKITLGSGSNIKKGSVFNAAIGNVEVLNSMKLTINQLTNTDGTIVVNKIKQNVEVTNAGLEIDTGIGLKLIFPAGLGFKTNVSYDSIEETRKGLFSDSGTQNTGSVIELISNGANNFDKDFTIIMDCTPGIDPSKASIYYYNERATKWVSIGGVYDPKTNTMTAKSSHFSNFKYDAPSIETEPPQAKGINTEPVNLKAVDPMPWIRTIAPPEPNNMGTANLSYPITLPEGINGVTPQLSIDYNSELRNGNCGEGWNLGVSTIEIDTRDKLPVLGGNNYFTDNTFMLDGQELVFIGDYGRGSVIEFRLKNERGSFLQIFFNKNSGHINVNKLDGTRVEYIPLVQYERTAHYHLDYNDLYLEHSNIKNSIDITKVSKWFLHKVISPINKDGIENNITYTYRDITYSDENIYDKNIGLQTYKRVNLALMSINYGNGYKVEVNRTKEIAHLEVHDTSQVYIPNYRSGYLTINPPLISNIVISFDNKPFKKHELKYIRDELIAKDLLETIIEKKVFSNGNELILNTNNMGYGADQNMNHFNPTSIDLADSPYDKWVYPYLEHGNQKMFIDINGDGILDFVRHEIDASGGDLEYRYMLGTGDRFMGENTFKLIGTDYSGITPRKKSRLLPNRFADINGDGILDFVRFEEGDTIGGDTEEGATSSIGDIFIWFRDSSNEKTSYNKLKTHIEYPERHKREKDYNKNKIPHSYSSLIDMTGDNLPDIVFKSKYSNDKNMKIVTNSGHDIPYYWGAFRAQTTKTKSEESYWKADDFHLYTYHDHNYPYLPTKIPPLDSNLKPRVIHEKQTDLIDINGDGLPDRVYKKNDSNHLEVWYNTGNGFILYWLDGLDQKAYEDKISMFVDNYFDFNESWGKGFTNVKRVPDHQEDAIIATRMMDINGDGLPDRYKYLYNGGSETIQFNTGLGFLPPVNLYGLSALTENECGAPLVINNKTRSDFKDIDGDGFIDKIYIDFIESWSPTGDLWYHPGELKIHKNLLPKRHLLTSVKHEQTGNKMDLKYENERLGSGDDFRKKLVLTNIRNHNIGYDIRTRITYEKGVYDKKEREFLGFKKVTCKEVYPDYEGKEKLNSRFDTSYYTNKRMKSIPHTFVHFDNSNRKISKSSVSYGEKELFSSREDIKLIYPKSKRAWYYDTKGVDLLVTSSTSGNKKDGYLFEENDIEIDSETGLISKKFTYSYGDPFHDKDNFVTETIFAKQPDRWINNKISDGMYTFYGSTDSKTINTDQKISEISYEYVSNSPFLSKKTAWDSNRVADAVTSFTYDDYGQLTTTTDPGGLTTTIETTYKPNEESSAFKMIKTVMPDKLTEISYTDPYGRVIKTIDKYGDETKYYYNRIGALDRIVDSDDSFDNPTTSIIYDKISRSEKDYYSALVLSKVDTVKTIKSNLDSYITGSDTNTSHEYIKVEYRKDLLGREAQTVRYGDVEGVDSIIISGEKKYDMQGRLIAEGSISVINQQTSNFSNNDISTQNGYTLYYYDARNRVVKTEYPGGKTIHNEYETLVEPYNSFVDNSYPEYSGDRILSKAHTYITDSGNYEQQSSVQIYKDLTGQEVKTIKDSNKVTEVDSNLLGISKIKEPGGKVGEKKISSLGKLIYQISPDFGRTKYKYNDKGLLQTEIKYGKTKNKILLTKYSYDDLNRPVRIFNGTEESKKITDWFGNSQTVMAEDGHVLQYTYYNIDDNAGKYNNSGIKSIKKRDTKKAFFNTRFSVNYNYDKYSISEIKTINGNSYHTGYSYNKQGQIKSLTYPDGDVITYEYDNLGRLYSIKNSSCCFIENILYDKNGQRSNLKYGNGLESTYSYDPLTNLLDTYSLNRNSKVHIKYEYNFDVVGNITGITGKIGRSMFSQEYRYDNNDRLNYAIGNYGNKYYTRSYKYYDDNRIREKRYSGTATGSILYTYNYNQFGQKSSHAPISISVNGGHSGFFRYYYDNYGNTTTKIYENLGEIKNRDIFKYDGQNRMAYYSNGDTEAYYGYDSSGRRIVKKVYINNSLESESYYVSGFYDIVDSVEKKHISDGSYIVASLSSATAGEAVYYHQNHIGSTAAVSNSKGRIINKYLYYPYGETWVNDKVESDDFIGYYFLDSLNKYHSGETSSEQEIESADRFFTGQLYDEESGLYYMNNRYYDPNTGMFTRPDPVMEGTNHYAYANCNPIMYNDPTGLYKSKWSFPTYDSIDWGFSFSNLFTRETSAKLYNKVKMSPIVLPYVMGASLLDKYVGFKVGGEMHAGGFGFSYGLNPVTDKISVDYKLGEINPGQLLDKMGFTNNLNNFGKISRKEEAFSFIIGEPGISFGGKSSTSLDLFSKKFGHHAFSGKISSDNGGEGLMSVKYQFGYNGFQVGEKSYLDQFKFGINIQAKETQLTLDLRNKFYWNMNSLFNKGLNSLDSFFNSSNNSTNSWYNYPYRKP